MNPLIDAAVWAAAAIAVLHWFPWRRLRGDDLPRLVAYVLGVACIFGSATAAYFRYTPAEAEIVFHLFWTAALAAGVTTLIAWGVDGLMEGSARKADLEDERHERKSRMD